MNTTAHSHESQTPVWTSFDRNDPEFSYRVVAENDHAFALVAFMPIVPGHLLICPIRVVKTSDELTEKEWRAIIELKKMCCRALQSSFQAEGFNYAWNEGTLAGQSVPHFHLHIVPRKKGDAGIVRYEPRDFLYRPGSRAVSASVELSEVALLLREHITSK